MTAGERVRLSAEGLLNHKRKQRHGTVVKTKAPLVWVRWDGNTNSRGYYVGHIERLAPR